MRQVYRSRARGSFMPVHEKVRFGPFQLDTECGQLRKNGIRLKLQGHPVQILELLLERPGELVTREAIRLRLWSSDTFVDFDHSLNAAMQRLRQALGDDAETPKYIETIPKRGYRFIAELDHSNTNQDHAPAPTFDEDVEKIAATLADAAITATKRSNSLAVWRTVAIAVFAALAIVAVAYVVTKPPPMPRVVGSHALTKTGYRKGLMALADGTSLYFQENRPDHTAIVQLRLTGGEVSEVATVPDSTFLSDVSHDGSELLFSALNPETNLFDAWVQPLPAGPARLIQKDAWAPVWTGDNRGIFFARNQHRELFRVNADGTNPQRIAALPDIAGIRVSPDGARVRMGTNFIVTRPSLLEVDSSGANPHAVLGDVQHDLWIGPWSPDGRFFFYLAWDNDRYDLWTLPEKHPWWQRGQSTPIQLTFGPVSIGAPAISSDGKQIYAAGLERHGELSVYDERSGQFVPYLSGISACYVDFSRDKQWIAYVSYPEGTLWRSRIDGSDRRQLTVPPLGVMNPRWSPDGKLIAFTVVSGIPRFSQEQQNWQMYVVSVDGGGPLLLLEGMTLNDPTWSPDGSSLAYGVGPMGSATLKILNLQTLKSTEVPKSVNLTSPRWSPDGKYLAALELNYPVKKMMLYSFASGQWEELAAGQLNWPSWSHDSQYVYAQEGNSVVRITIANHKKEQVASLRGIRTAAYYFDRIGLGWFGLTPDDRIVTTRDTGVEEIYAFDLEYK